MQQKIPTIVYIDATNLYKGVESLRKKIDYKKFKTWLLQKYNAAEVILFMGYRPEQDSMYASFKKLGYTIVFKESIEYKGKMKGNADAELVLRASRNFFEKEDHKSIIISADGDFSCLVDFFIEKDIFKAIIIPNRKNCSYLLRKKNIPMVYIEDIIHKFEKTPG